MSAVPVAWLWQGPTETLDRLLVVLARVEKADKAMRELERQR